MEQKVEMEEDPSKKQEGNDSANISTGDPHAMGDITTEQQMKVMTFQAITETHDPEIALHFLAENDWDESVRF